MSAQACADRVAELLVGGLQQPVDVLEGRAALLAVGERERPDHRVIQVPPRGREQLVLVDVQQRGDDVLGDLRGLEGQRPLTGAARAGSSRTPGARGPGTRRACRSPGGVYARHRCASSLLGSRTIGAASGSRMSLRYIRSSAAVFPVPCPPTAMTPNLRSSGWISAGAVLGAQHRQLGRAAGDGRVHRVPPVSAAVAVAGAASSCAGVGTAGVGVSSARIASGGHRDPRQREPADGDALHPRRRQREQVRDLPGRHQAAQRRARAARARAAKRRRYRPWRTVIQRRCSRFSPRRDCTAAAIVLHASAGVGGDLELEPEQAAVLGALRVAHLRAVQRRPQAALRQPPALLAHEPVLVAAVQPAGELLEVRRGGGQLKAHDRRLRRARSARARSARAAATRAPRRRRRAGRRTSAPCGSAARTRARAARRARGTGRSACRRPRRTSG